MRMQNKFKKTRGEILAVNEIHERHPKAVRTYGIVLRYESRTGIHNIYKEYRDLTLNGAISQLCT
jgi:large subunit ribosomal protein L18Ae